jgi:hypothetical protein
MLIKDICENPFAAPEPDPTSRLYGVEVEYENVVDAPSVRSINWSAVPDGSLRNNGLEFITPPIPLHQAVTAFRNLNTVAEGEDWEDTARTGIHVHADMRDLTFDRVKGVIAAYAAFEPLMFKLVEESREENIYCVPWYRAPDQAGIVPFLGRGRMDTERTAGIACVKYSALYLRPLWRFGTLEFRQAETWREPAPFRRWICAISRLVEWGKDETPASVIEKCSANPNQLVRDIFGWTMRHVTDPESVMDDVNSLATVDEMIPYTYKESDWTWDNCEGVLAGVGYHEAAGETEEDSFSEPEPDEEYETDYNEDEPEREDRW